LRRPRRFLYAALSLLIYHSALQLLRLTNPTLFFVRKKVWNAVLTGMTEFNSDR
jgi:hypothetical protein